jgi:hypothetical protein
MSTVQRGLILLKRRVGLLVFLHRAGSRRGKVTVATRISLGEGEPGARGFNGSLLLFYDRWLA